MDCIYDCGRLRFNRIFSRSNGGTAQICDDLSICDCTDFCLFKLRFGQKEGHLSTIMKWYALAGIVFLTGFTVLFLLQFFGMIG